VKRGDLPIGMWDQSPEVVARFRKLVAAGQSPSMAEIFACRKAPGLETDTAHFAGLSMSHVAKSAGVPYADKVMAQAKKAGISVNQNSIYNASIADARGGGDPNAWLLAGDGRAKFRKSIESKGGECETLGVKCSGKGLELFANKEALINKRKARREEIKAERASKLKV